MMRSAEARDDAKPMSETRRRRQEIRRAILQAAIREFARNGLEGTSTQTLADAAGLSKAQLHYYISSKEELYEEAILHIIAEWKHIFFVDADSTDPARVIGSYIARKVRHSIEHPEVTRLFARELSRGAPVLRRHWGALRESVDRASSLIEGWVERGLVEPVDPVLFQMHIWAVTQHYAEYEAQARHLLGLREAESLDADRIAAEATRMFLMRCGLTPDGSAAGISET